MQVHYYLAPANNVPFNVPLLEQRVAALPGAFRLNDPREMVYVITASKNMAKYIAAKLQMDPRHSLSTQGMITLSATSITIYQDVPHEILSQMEGFVTWLLNAIPCRVLSEEGEDWTARYARNPAALFVEEDRWK